LCEELPTGKLDAGQSDIRVDPIAAGGTQRRKVVLALPIEKCVVRERAGGDDPFYAALDDAFGGLGVLLLFAYGDLVAGRTSLAT
jgi:hypothetical protein